MSRLLFFIFLCLTLSNAQAQFTHDGRGMYVDKFFRTTVSTNGSVIVDNNFSILSIPAKENALLQYARDNHITYLILYDIYRVLGNSTYEGYLCSFMQKAKTQYCIEKIGVASSCAAMFDNIASIGSSPAITIPSSASQDIQSRFDFLKRKPGPSDKDFVRSEIAKMVMRTATFNESCAYKFDVLVTEFEFWTSGTDNCTDASVSKDQKYQNYQTMILDMDVIRDDYNSTHADQIYVETYLGYLNQNTAYAHQDIANWIDGMNNGHRRVDRINQHYYSTDATKLYSRTSAGQNNSGYYLTRFLDFCQPSTNNNTEVMPIFSSENTAWGAASSFLGSWFNQSPANNIFTAEKIWYNDWKDDSANYHQSTVGSATAGSMIRPGEVLWFTSGQMAGHLNNPLMYTSNSPVCAGATQSAAFQFQYTGPIEQGVSYKFYLTTTGTNTVQCGSTASIPWNRYDYTTQTSIDLNAALNGCLLPAGDYDVHFEMMFDSCYTYVVPVQQVSVVNAAKIVALTSTTACQGNPVYLQASSTAGVSTTYAWYDGSSPISGATSQYFAATSTGTHSYSCKITGSAGGCSANLSNVIPVTINTYPLATITLQSASGCSVTLKANPTSSTYAWHNGSTSSTFTTSQSGTYSVAVTKNGCTATASYSNKKVKVDFVQKTNPCQNVSNGTITVNLYQGVSPYTVSWSGPTTGSSSGNASGNKTISNLAPGTYTIVVTDAGGCTSSTTSTLTVALIATVTGDTASCSGDTLSLFSSAGTSYAWTGPNSFTSALQNPFVANANVVNGGLYRVTVTGSTGCTSSASITSNVYARPSAVITMPSPVCESSSVTISVPGGSSCLWSGPSGFTSTSASNLFSNIQLSAAGNYNVVVTNSHGCTASSTSTLEVNPRPAVSISGVTTVCSGDAISLSSTPATSYSWSGPSNFISTQQSISIASAASSNAGNYILTVTNNSSCTNSTSVNVSVNARPSATAQGDDSICVGSIIHLIAGGGGSYLWSGPAAFNSSLQSPIVSNAAAANAGVYNVVVTGANGCSSSASVNVFVMIPQVFYPDADGDGFGDNNFPMVTCTPTGSYSTFIGGDCDDNNALIHPGAIEICGNGIDEDCDGLSDNGCTNILHLKVFIEGFYDSLGIMTAVVNPVLYPSLCDTVVAELHSTVSPYQKIVAYKSVIDIHGEGDFYFSSIMGSPYYLVIRHRNSLETWSSVPVSFTGSTVNYDFTLSASAAAGNNLDELGDGSFAIFSGDVSDGFSLGHDGQINNSDLNYLKDALRNFLTGYQTCDLTGDGIVESSDFSIIEKNAAQQHMVVRP